MMIYDRKGVLKVTLKISIKYFDKNMPRLKRLEQGDWIDLRSRETFVYKAGDFIKVPLGVAMELPKNYEAHIVPRSSTFKNFGVIMVNSPGIVDESYKGDDDEWFVLLYALRDGKIEKYDRIVQFRIVEKMPPVEFEEKERLGNKNRCGEGSTGIK